MSEPPQAVVGNRVDPWTWVAAGIAIAVGGLVALLYFFPTGPMTLIVGAMVVAFAVASYLNPNHWLRRRSAMCLTIAGACAATPLLESALSLGPNFAPWLQGSLKFATNASPWAAAVFGSLSIAYAKLERMPVTQEVAQSLGRIEMGQADLPTKEDFQRMEDRLIKRLRAGAPQGAPVDPSTERDLIAAVERLANDAARGVMTAQRILESDNPADVADYLAARRAQLDRGQQRLNERLEEAKIELDREFAAVAFTTGRIDEAERALRRILDALPDDRDALNRLGQIEVLRGRLERADACYRHILQLSHDDEFVQAVANGHLGTILRLRGDLDGAEKTHGKALAIHEKLGHVEGVASEYGNLGIVLQTRGDLDGAEQLCRKALAIFEKLDDLESMAKQYGNLGAVRHTRGDLDGAEDMFCKALAINEKLGRLAGIAMASGNLGLVRESRGDLDGAEEMHRMALEIDERIGSLDGMARHHLNLGNVRQTRGDLDGAEEMYRKALALGERLGSLICIAAVYGNLANVCQRRGDLDGAEEMHRRSLSIYVKLGHLEGAANGYGNLGVVRRKRGDLDGAEEMHRKSLSLHEALGSLEGMAGQCINLGTIRKDLGDSDGARVNWVKSRDLYTLLGAPHMVQKVQGWIDNLPPAG